MSFKDPNRFRPVLEEIEPRDLPSALNLSAWSPATAEVGSTLAVSGNVSSNLPISSLSVTYLWGNGANNTDPYSYPSGNLMIPISHSHTYLATGNYTIQVTANATYTDGTLDTAVGYYPVSIVPSGGGGGTGGGGTGLPDVSVDAIFNTVESPTAPAPVGQFNLIRTGGNMSQSLTVGFLVAGSAVAGSDYHSIANTGSNTGSVTFAQWASTATISVTSLDDLIGEGVESVIVTLIPNPSLFHLVTPAGMDTCLIVDNETAPIGSGQGLYGRYYGGANFGTLNTSRIDPTVEFNWVYAAPTGTSLPADDFSVRWTGKVEPRHTGDYTFYVNADDGSRLWVNGTLLFDRWANGPGPGSGTIALNGGQKYDIKLEYFENQSGAQVQLEWQHASQARQIIPASQLYPNVVSEGTGLLGTYYNTPYLAQATGNNSPTVRVDATLNFTWGALSPIALHEVDKVSVRWTGRVQALATGSHVFYLNADDGVRLWVNGQLLINDWTTTAGLRTGLPIELIAGQLYDILIEYYEWTGSAEIQLSWSYPNQSKVIVPSTQLYPTSASPVYHPTGSGLIGTYMWRPSGTGPNAVQTSWIDEQVNFDWGSGNPTNGSTVVPADNFTVRWTGYVEPQYTERYQFSTFTDDGVIVWVNGQRAVKNYVNAAGDTGPFQEFDLVAGQRYPITMQYYEGQGTAAAKLFWSSPSQPRQAIPSNRLYPAVPTPPAGTGRLVDAGGTTVGLLDMSEAQYFASTIAAPRDKLTILTGIPFWRQSGSPILPMPGDVTPEVVAGGNGWSGSLAPGAYKGPNGNNTCVGVALIPDDPQKPTYMLHFGGRNDVSGGFIRVGFVQNGVPATGYRAVLAGAAWQDNDLVNRERLYTLDRVVLCLGNYGVPIVSYVAAEGFAVDANGWVYWTSPPGANVAAYEN